MFWLVDNLFSLYAQAIQMEEHYYESFELLRFFYDWPFSINWVTN